jgi:signal transduction histidine kinase
MENGFRVTTQFEENLPPAMADADMLYQAFLNILINAMQSMPDGGEISVKVQTGENCLWIAFEDQGCGIAVDAMEKIWAPFFTTKDKGTGLGLGIV